MIRFHWNILLSKICIGAKVMCRDTYREGIAALEKDLNFQHPSTIPLLRVENLTAESTNGTPLRRGGADKLHKTPFETLLRPRVGAVGLIAPIPPNGGAFTVWPGTHKIIYDLIFRTEGLAWKEAYKNQIVDFNNDRHVEGWGDVGDVLLWHGLLAHSAGWNRLEKLQLREAVLCDYDQYEVEKPKASYEDMWGDWSDEVRTTAG